VNEVISDDGEVALALTSSILKKLGATPEQLAEELERTRIAIRNSLTLEQKNRLKSMERA